MKVLVPLVGFFVGFGLACSRSIEDDDDDDEYQARIDEYCATVCNMHMECTVPRCADFNGCEAYGDDTYDGCFDECSEGTWWWKGDRECKDARWEFYDCRASITDCDEWLLGIDDSHPCNPAWNTHVIECHDVADED